MSNTIHRFKYGANFKIIGKTEPQKLSYAGAFSPVTGTFKDLAAHISEGHLWMPGESKETVMKIVEVVCDRGVES